MRAFLTKAIPVITLVLFILIMLSGGFLKKSFGSNDDLPKLIDEIKSEVSSGAWDRVSAGAGELEKAWKKLMVRVQFSSERDEINSLSNSIARLRGAAQAQDKANALIELDEAYNHWKEIGR